MLSVVSGFDPVARGLGLKVLSHLRSITTSFTATSLLGANYTQGSEFLIDLVDVDIHSVSQSQHQTPGPTDLWGLAAPDPHPSGPNAPSAALSLLDGELLSLGNVYVLQLSIFLCSFNCCSSHRGSRFRFLSRVFPTYPSCKQINGCQPEPSFSLFTGE